MRRDFSLWRRLRLFRDVNGRTLFYTKSFFEVVSGETIAVIKKHFSSQNEYSFADSQIFRVVIFGDFFVRAFEVDWRKIYRPISPYLQDFFLNLIFFVFLWITLGSLVFRNSCEYGSLPSFLVWISFTATVSSWRKYMTSYFLMSPYSESRSSQIALNLQQRRYNTNY